MDNTQQVETLKKALALEEKIIIASHNMKRIKQEKFYDMPPSPTRNIIQRKYPEIKSTVKFEWAKALLPVGAGLILLMIPSMWIQVFGGLVFMLSFAWLAFYYFAIHGKKKKENIEQIRNSAEYKSLCAVADEEFDKTQNEADAVYEKQSEEYAAVVLPKYENELQNWTIQHNEELSSVSNDLSSAQDALSKLYEETKIVPLQYRSFSQLKFIYDTISTSDYDIKAAIEMYDRTEQRKLDEERIRQQEHANILADEQNQLLYEQNEIRDQMRKDARNAAVVNAAQQHKTNKILKDLSKK